MTNDERSDWFCTAAVRKLDRGVNELPRGNLTGYQNLAMRIYPKRYQPPDVFIGGPVPVLPVASPAEPPIEAFGNDGPPEISY